MRVRRTVLDARARALALASGSVLAQGCGGDEAGLSERHAELVEPLPASDPEVVAVSGSLVFERGRIEGRRVEGRLMPRRPVLDGEAAPAHAPAKLILTTQGLAGTSGRLGVLPALAAARQEVAFGSPGQPDDPRCLWQDLRFEVDGEQVIELPAPGSDWHAAEALVVLELYAGLDGPGGEGAGATRLPLRRGPRSEMVEGGGRAAGGRAVLAQVPVERRPAAVEVAAIPLGAVTLDGSLDEDVWSSREGTALSLSRTGEPALDLDAKLGGPTRVWFAWDEDALYVAATLPDPDLFAPHQGRDDPLYREEAFEVFFAGDSSGSRYLEHQVSARGVHFDARFPEYRKGDEAWNGSWRSAVLLDGELDGRGHDRGWTVELAFSWSELCAETAITCPPKPGQRLRSNVFRLDKPGRKGQVGLALSPTLRPDFHAWTNAAILALGEDSAP